MTPMPVIATIGSLIGRRHPVRRQREGRGVREDLEELALARGRLDIGERHHRPVELGDDASLAADAARAAVTPADGSAPGTTSSAISTWSPGPVRS